MITLSAYTENTFVPVCESSPHEPPQVHSEENEHDDFAEILAGLLNKTAEGQPSIDEQAFDEQVNIDDQSSLKIDKTDKSQSLALNSEDAAAFIGETKTSEEIQSEKIDGADSEEGIADFQAESEIQELVNAERLINQETVETDALLSESFAQDFNIEEAVFQTSEKVTKDFSGVKSETDKSAKLDFSSMLETEDAASLEQKTAAVTLEKSAEADNTEKLNKKAAAKETSLNKNEAENLASLQSESLGEEAELRTDAKSENLSRLDEARGKDRRGKVSFDIHDFRTEGDKNSQAAAQHSAELASVKAQDASPREINLELHLPDNNSANLGQSSAQTNWDTKAAPVTNSAAMENLLARELHQNFNGDIVRHASMALHDGGAGTIRIALKPETLGNVKIHLEMSENKVTGQIIVESEEALNAFKKEIASLEQAFMESGFSNAELNLSLDLGNENADAQEAQSFSPRMIASRYDDASEISPHRVDVFFGQKQGAVNMLA